MATRRQYDDCRVQQIRPKNGNDLPPVAVAYRLDTTIFCHVGLAALYRQLNHGTWWVVISRLTRFKTFDMSNFWKRSNTCTIDFAFILQKISRTVNFLTNSIKLSFFEFSIQIFKKSVKKKSLHPNRCGFCASSDSDLYRRSDSTPIQGRPCVRRLFDVHPRPSRHIRHWRHNGRLAFERHLFVMRPDRHVDSALPRKWVKK